MKPVTNLVFTGRDGKRYTFDVYPHNIRVNDGPALYAFLKKLENRYFVLYIGQTTDLSERLKNHHKWDEAERLGFKYLAICRDVQARNLEADEANLIQKYLPRCNEVVPH